MDKLPPIYHGPGSKRAFRGDREDCLQALVALFSMPCHLDGYRTVTHEIRGIMLP